MRNVEAIGITDARVIALKLVVEKPGRLDNPILLIQDGGLSTINLVGTSAPGGGLIQSVGLVRTNNSGTLLIPFSTSGNALFGAEGLVLVSGGSSIPVAFSGAPVPGGGNFRSFRFAAINNSEEVVFPALLNDQSTGIFRRNPDGTLVSVVRDRAVLFSPLTTFPSINDRGDIAAFILGPSVNQILFITSNGDVSKVIGQNDPAPGGGTFRVVFPVGINNKGEVIFFAFLSNGKTGIFKASRGLETEFVDPVPDLLADSTVTSEPTELANKGRVVTGITADGAARVVVRVKTGQTGTAEFSLVDENGAALPPSNFNGSLSQVSEDFGSGSVSVSTVDVEGVGPMAFAAYHAPMDFATSPNSKEAGDPDRKVFVKIKLTTSTGETVESTESLKIVRPPVILVHGLWGSPDSWDNFEPLIGDSRFSKDKFFNQRIDYFQTNAESFGVNALIVVTKLKDLIRDYKVENQVAAVQADLVTHSMGGLLVRMLPVFSSSFLRDDNFTKGDVHKLINIGTPHRGSELAAKLRTKKNNLLCRGAFNIANSPIDQGAIDDLSPGSDALRVINGFPSSIPVHNNVGIASALQKQVNSSGFLLNSLQLVCGEIIPQGGFDELFKGDNSDLLVSTTSQRGGLSSASSAVTNFPPSGPNLIHTTANGVFGVADGEAELESQQVSSRVIRLLSSSMNSALFMRLLP